MDTRADRISYLTDFLENIEECSRCLSEPSIIKMVPDHVLSSARGKLRRRQDEVLQEMEKLRLDMSSENVESAQEVAEANLVDVAVMDSSCSNLDTGAGHEELAQKVAEANPTDVAPNDSTSSRKRSREDLMELDADSDDIIDIDTLFESLLITDRSVYGWLEEQEGGRLVDCLKSMIRITGKRLSAVTTEMVYLMAYGPGSVAIWHRFKSDIEAEVSKSLIVKARISKTIRLSENLTELHLVDDIHPELHDVLFEESLAGLVTEFSTMTEDVESIFDLQKELLEEPPSDILKRITEQLMEMDAGIHSIEYGAMNCRILFSAYSDLAKSRIDDFSRDSETPVNELWDEDLARRNFKRSRV